MLSNLKAMRVWQNLSYESKLTGTFILFFVLLSANAVLWYVFIHKTQEKEAVFTEWKTLSLATQQAITVRSKSDISTIDLEKSIFKYDELLTSTLTGSYYKPLDANVPKLDADSYEQAMALKVKWDTLQLVLSNTNTRSITNIANLIESWLEYNSAFLISLQEASQAANRRLVLYNIIFWCVSFLIIFLTLYLIKKEFFTPFSILLEKGQRLGEGNKDVEFEDNYRYELGQLEATYKLTSETLTGATDFIRDLENGKVRNEALEIKDESIQKALVDLQRQLKSLQDQENNRKWISEGLTRFADLLRSKSNSIQELSDHIIHELVKYTNSLIGAVYILNEENTPTLELTSLYALNTKKYEKKSYKIGEGLVGQTFLEREYLYLLEIPEDYVKITTGIGEMTPNAILLVPLKVENDVFGVIELASSSEYESFQIEFVKKLSESIAGTIQNVQGNEQTRKLLEESQQMTEQMRSQEEEMRQNMEELAATQEEMSRKENSINQRLDNIDKAVAIAEYDKSFKILHCNNRFAELHKSEPHLLQELTIFQLLESTYHESVRNIWTRQNEHPDFIHTRISKTGESFKASSLFTFHLNANGDFEKVIEVLQKTDVHTETHYEDTHSLQDMLQTSLKGLDIAQQELDQKKAVLEKQQVALPGTLQVIVTNHKGEVIQTKNDNIDIDNVIHLPGIEDTVFQHDEMEGTVVLDNKQARYYMVKIEKQSYLFLFSYI